MKSFHWISSMHPLGWKIAAEEMAIEFHTQLLKTGQHNRDEAPYSNGFEIGEKAYFIQSLPGLNGLWAVYLDGEKFRYILGIYDHALNYWLSESEQRARSVQSTAIAIVKHIEARVPAEYIEASLHSFIDRAIGDLVAGRCTKEEE